MGYVALEAPGLKEKQSVCGWLGPQAVQGHSLSSTWAVRRLEGAQLPLLQRLALDTRHGPLSGVGKEELRPTSNPGQIRPGAAVKGSSGTEAANTSAMRPLLFGQEEAPFWKIRQPTSLQEPQSHPPCQTGLQTRHVFRVLVMLGGQLQGPLPGLPERLWGAVVAPPGGAANSSPEGPGAVIPAPSAQMAGRPGRLCPLAMAFGEGGAKERRGHGHSVAPDGRGTAGIDAAIAGDAALGPALSRTVSGIGRVIAVGAAGGRAGERVAAGRLPLALWGGEMGSVAQMGREAPNGQAPGAHTHLGGLLWGVLARQLPLAWPLVPRSR